MKYAICFTGRIKTWENNLRGIIDTLEQSFGSENIDYFASVHGDPNDKYVIDFLNALKPVSYNIEMVPRIQRDTLWKEKMYSSLYHKWKCFKLVENSKKHYDWVFMFRCDFKKSNIINLPDNLPLKNILYVPNPDGNPENLTKRTPDHIDGGSVETMSIFSNFFLEIEDYINKGGVPETILCDYITNKGLSMKEFYWWTELDSNRGGYDTIFYD